MTLFVYKCSPIFYASITMAAQSHLINSSSYIELPSILFFSFSLYFFYSSILFSTSPYHLIISFLSFIFILFSFFAVEDDYM